MSYDMVVQGGTVVDGTGAARRRADVGVKDGVVVAVGPDLDATDAEVVDATDRIVTPGFVDVHTHYDGQVTWDDRLEPSSGHGVTTVVMGNCGVGFAPVRPGRHEWLIQLMEGVEDIPGSALSEGMTWGWETFPEYLDALDKRELSIDVGTQVAHGAVRGYVMEDRGAANEPATADDIAAMADIVREAIEAGALGVSTSRTIAHKAMDGEPVPGTFAAEDEVFGLGRALAAGGGGVFELAPVGSAGEDIVAPRTEVDWMRRLSAETGQTISFALLQVEAAPNLWREIMQESIDAIDAGSDLRPQIAARPFGLLIGLQTHHAFGLRPSYKAISHLPLEERVAELRKPATRAAILSEADGAPDPAVLFDGVAALVQAMLHKIYVIGDPPDYEPTEDRSVAALASAAGIDPMEMAYDALVEGDGSGLMMLPLFNYVDGNHDVIREQLLHPAGVSGLSDGGAHCGMICDASIPTTMMSHWARDRSRGQKLDLEYVVKKQSLDTASMFGLGDRGSIEVGKRADMNVIDFDRLTLRAPQMAHDLPAGGRRLIQQADGYDATIVAGQTTRRHGVDTGARPGRLVRGRR